MEGFRVKKYGAYDVIVVGAGMTGIVTSVAAAREGASVLLVESSGMVGGLITGGRLTKPTGIIQPGVYRELVERAAEYGGADPDVRHSYWGTYSGVFDAEIMQRVIIEVLEEARVEVLLFTDVNDVVHDHARVAGVQLGTKSGTQLAFAGAIVDASGDGDVAVLAGADFMYGRPEDGRVQPMTSYFRVLNVNFDDVVKDCLEHENDVRELVLPDPGEDYAMTFFMAGFTERIAAAQEDGFDWIIPKNHITMKAGLLDGEMNINATRVHGNGLDPRERSRAALEVRKQVYCSFDFLKRYVRGFEDAVMFDVAPVLGIRETRRITGDYVLTEKDVRGEARFDDAIGLSNAPIDIHDPAGEEGIMNSVSRGYGVPYRCLLPAGVDGMLVAGRCISVDAVAFGSTRNTPVCALTGQAAGIAAAQSAQTDTTPRTLSVDKVQRGLASVGVVLGTSADERLFEDQK